MNDIGNRFEAKEPDSKKIKGFLCSDFSDIKAMKPFNAGKTDAAEYP